MISRILVPMDDSEMAEQALTYALDNHPEANITVLHAVGGPTIMMGQAVGLALEENLDEAAAERAEPVFERGREVAADRDRQINTVVEIGHRFGRSLIVLTIMTRSYSGATGNTV